MGTMGIYKPLYVWCSPASIPQIVAHIQDYLVKNPIVSTETVAEIVVQSLQEHPELINGSVIPITEDSAQTIKEYIDALPLLDGYTKAETDALLLLKQNLLTWDQTPTAGSSNPVTSEGIKAAISATAAALADLISTKADIASVYTKSVMDTLLIQKANVATTYSKNAVDALLDTKVDINDTYTKSDIDLMKQVDKANTAIVSSTDGTAPLNIAAGQYVYLNDILYMATQAIPENDPLVPGTNIVLTPKGVANNIGDGLQSLARTVGEQSDQIANLDYSNAGAHNAIYRGKYLGSSVTAEQWAQIKAGTFGDMYIGDYWTINGVNWRIAGFDYWVNAYFLSTHHVVIVPDSNLASSPINSTDTTSGAYYNSDFRTGNNSNTGRATAITAVNNAFGSAHILSYKDFLHSAVTDGHPSGQEWADCTVELMNEEMVYGAHIFAPIGTGASLFSNYTTSKSQLPLFQHEHSHISNCTHWWLRSVVSETSFANLRDYGHASGGLASIEYGVRPAFGIFQSEI